MTPVLYILMRTDISMSKKEFLSRMQKITNQIENEVGYVVSHDYLPSFFVTDSNPIEANIQRLEDEDWSGCCNTWECAL